MISGDLDRTQQAQAALMVKANQDRINEVHLKHERNEPLTKQEIDFLIWRAKA